MTPSRVIDTIYKKQFSKMVIALAKYTGLRDLATAEDIVQESFAEAAKKWTTQMPDDPEAWLYRVCRNIALNHLRNTKKFEQDFTDHEKSLTSDVDSIFEIDTEDDQLRMLIACTHPNFSTKNQVIFALRYVAGFRIEQIANILGSPSDTITKTLLRMRETIVRENINFTFEISDAKPDQVQVLHKIIYLMFSEGSKISSSRSILNFGLCEDALSLSLDISRQKELALPETHALIALMLFNLSRFEARFTEAGDLIEHEYQDRSLWNQELIKVGVHHMSLAGDQATSYHVEATIAWLHVSAPSFKATDWPKISSLYDRLLQFNDSPFVKMNQSIALFYAGDVLTSLHQLKKIGESAFMQQHYLLHIALGKVYASMLENAKALEHFKKALELSPHAIEKRHIQKLIATFE
jgi:RNA polymerase sigma-70 factor (ECF subfamily)